MTAPAAKLCRPCAAALAEVMERRRSSFTFCASCQPGIDATMRTLPDPDETPAPEEVRARFSWRKLHTRAKYYSPPLEGTAYMVHGDRDGDGAQLALGIVWPTPGGLWHFVADPDAAKPTSNGRGWLTRQRAAEAMLHHHRSAARQRQEGTT